MCPGFFSETQRRRFKVKEKGASFRNLSQDRNCFEESLAGLLLSFISCISFLVIFYKKEWLTDQIQAPQSNFI